MDKARKRRIDKAGKGRMAKAENGRIDKAGKGRMVKAAGEGWLSQQGKDG